MSDPYKSLLSLEDEPRAEPGSPQWVITFSDMVTLMLCFFVLLLSFASTDSESFRSAAGSVRQAFGAARPAPLSKPAAASAPEVAAEASAPPSATPATIERVRAYLSERGLNDAVDVLDSPRGVVIRAKDRVLFATAEAELKPEGLAVLDTVTVLSFGFDGRLAVEGHSDDRPMQSTRFPSNWELSSARAGAVLRYLLEQGVDPALVYVAGYAHTRPIADNATNEGRALNRRVEFVFEPTPR